MSIQTDETDVEPTPGPWQIRDTDSALTTIGPPDVNWDVAEVRLPDGHMSTPIVEVPAESYCRKSANARLIAAAGTAAQEAREMGYDPVAAVEALPELLSALEDAYREQPAPTVEVALASAEGDGQQAENE